MALVLKLMAGSPLVGDGDNPEFDPPAAQNLWNIFRIDAQIKILKKNFGNPPVRGVRMSPRPPKKAFFCDLLKNY